jgi:hypothetical protein
MIYVPRAGLVAFIVVSIVLGILIGVHWCGYSIDWLLFPPKYMPCC